MLLLNPIHSVQIYISRFAERLFQLYAIHQSVPLEFSLECQIEDHQHLRRLIFRRTKILK